ncbi:Dbl homology domain-containing protein [Parathielavia hyrcaniae]|uniref:Dbl homology domain-containing protein n=1 Tax=Parathielavia hyrcaniae TaxID=113614 RepID=A0AAN6QER5_9PEZI|nr:Dbl homology domain-containing protein [Parathielavia hyrcaniae]
MARDAEQPEDADPEANPADDEEEAGSEGSAAIRALRRQDMLEDDDSTVPWLNETANVDDKARPSAHHRHSSSDSSLAFVTAVKSATVSVAGVSLLTRSRTTTIRSSRRPRTEHSRRASLSGPRVSEDSCCPERQLPLDRAVTERAVQRRRILEELISTEESYVGDVQFLMSVYVTVLASLPGSAAGLRSSASRNLTDIMELHEEILGELHRVVPDSEYIQPDLSIRRTRSSSSIRGHFRWSSLDAVPECKEGASSLPEVPGMTAEPSTAAEVSKVFSKRMNRFFVYEEYGAKYEMMIKDVAAAHRTMPGWLSYQKGLEVLASSLGSADSRDNLSRKALTAGDLLVKYPLLFAELLKYTPVIDCPYSHMEIENTLSRLREATAEINRATNDCRTKSVLEKTWVLQDRLMFPNLVRATYSDAASKNRIRSFGHIQLCGALHVCWQTKGGVSGQYMVALLYREWFCLATAGRIDQTYTIQACIALASIKVEDADNGRARHSWKIVFLSNSQLYELILTACSPKEELEWCARLKDKYRAVTPNSQERTQSDMSNFLSLNVKSLGAVWRKPGSIARKITIHRATTIGPKSPLYQVILKNTSAAKQGPTSPPPPPSSTTTSTSQPPSPSSSTTTTSSSSPPSTSPSSLSPSSSPRSNPPSQPINRSQSLQTTNSRIPVLAPARAERARLESLLADVWTRDALPYPGMTAARSRSEQLASSMMRKLSAVSIAAGAGFGRRETVPAPLLVADTDSASASRREHDEAAAPEPHQGAEGSGEACPDIPRRASASEEVRQALTPESESAVRELLEAGGNTPDPRGSRAPSLGKGVSKFKTSLGDERSPRTSRKSSLDLKPGRCAMEEPGRVTEIRRVEERRPAPSARRKQQKLVQNQGRGKAPTKLRPRSHGLKGRPAETGLKRRDVVAEGIRSLFR